MTWKEKMTPEKNKQAKFIILSCAVVLVVTCICVSLIGLGGVGVSLAWPFGSRKPDVQMPTPLMINETEPGEDGSPAGEGTPSPDVEGEDVPEELAESMDRIQAQVIEIRGLEPTGPVPRTLISPDELQDIVANDFFSEYTDQDSRQDVLILSALGLLPNDFSLKQFYQDLYSEQIAGFYDDDIKAMYVVQGAGFGGAEKITYAHEYTHVLQDQIYDLSDGLGYNDDACEADSERCAAIQALIEGDASMTELLWFQTYATEEDYDDLMQFYENFDTPVLDQAPPYMSADLYFPYEKGQIFVQLLYNEGGFAAVDEAYQNLPVSTEQILHPERYPDDIPQIVTLPELSETLGEGWSLLDQNVMGEWYTFLILNKGYEPEERIQEPVAEKAAEGWGGDAYAFYVNETQDQVVFVMDTVWDTRGDAEEFADAFESYAGLRWDDGTVGEGGTLTWQGGGLSVLFFMEDDRTVWVMAPSMEMANAVFSTIR
jgi:hypothetical protein